MEVSSDGGGESDTFTRFDFDVVDLRNVRVLHEGIRHSLHVRWLVPVCVSETTDIERSFGAREVRDHAVVKRPRG